MHGATAGAPNQNADLVATLASVAKLFTGSQQTQTTGGGSNTVSSSGGTTTKQTLLSEDAINALLKNLLEGTSGLASIAQGAKLPGLYNSSTQQLLTNDLLSRSAGEVAKATAPTVTTDSPRTETRVSAPQTITTKTPAAISPTAGLLGAGAIALGSKAGRQKIQDIYESILGEDNTKAIADFGNMTAGELSSALSSGGFTDTIPANLGGTMTDFSSSFAPIQNWDQLVGGGSFTDTLTSFDVGSFLGASSGLDFGSWSVDPTSAYTDGLSGVDVLGDTGGGGIPGLSAGIKVLTGGNITSADVGGFLGSALGGPVGGVVGNLVGSQEEVISDTVSDGINSFLDDTGCFITTATCRALNKDDNCEELQILRYFRDTWLTANNPEDVTTYYNTAPAMVAKLSTHADKDALYAEFYSKYIAPAVAHIKFGQYAAAYAIYRELYFRAAEVTAEV